MTKSPPRPHGVALVDNRFTPAKHYLLAAGESTNGLTVVSISPQASTILFKIDGKDKTIYLDRR